VVVRAALKISGELPRHTPVLFFRFATASGEHMSIDSIKQEVRAEISRLQQVLTLLGGGSARAARGESVSSGVSTGRKRRKISAAGRARIAAAQKARWAKIRAAKK
jgi:hypothetical protein